HPPWRAEWRNPQTGVVEAKGTGVAYACYRLKLPRGGAARFESDVAMDRRALGEGKTDGVLFAVVARAREKEERAEVYNATDRRQRLTLDLSGFAGQDVELELSVHPGPAQNATFDWARWFSPRVVYDASRYGEMVVAPRAGRLALSGTRVEPVRAEGRRYRVRASFPGAVYLLEKAPERVALPFSLGSASFCVTVVSDDGAVLTNAPYAGAAKGEGSVGGARYAGLSAHPPDHGRTIVDVPLTLPDDPAEFHAFVGIRDGSRSDGVRLSVEANGIELAGVQLVPGGWREVRADLSPWAGRPVVLSLVSDSMGSHQFDWAFWGEPTVRAK
ncbi:MAG: hypothetical protein QHJ73_19840, partial [Armatimonadota bacterium]|nr:hypothetical protein [Armatimonadota bacterium]